MSLRKIINPQPHHISSVMKSDLTEKTREQLPEDMVLEIFARLPVKSVVRLRILSKQYNALTRETSFITKHLSRSMVKAKSKPNFLLFHQINKFFISSMVYEGENSKLTLVDLKPPFIINSVSNIIAHAHSNGIIYLELLNGPCNPNQKILWNPATREVKYLPFPPPMKPALCSFFHVAHGFGFDPKTNDYKVVNIEVGVEFFLEEYEKLNGQVYSLRSDSWKVVNIGVSARYIAKSMFNSYLNGAYHWLAESGGVEFVLCFNMSEDVFSKMNLPKVISQEKNNKFYIRHSNIVVLNECVCYVREYMRSEFHFEIWMMNEYGVEETWVRMFNLVRGPCPEILLELWKDDDDDVSVLGGEEYQPLVLYKIGEQKVVKEFPLHLGIERRAFRYVESVVPLCGLVHEEA